ncbi:unnamed protein product [Mytilus coruscus]|uniref:Uncharacterized protein n=1 Tax=Mytilus coruscus TaxID=42192 RepID=A0A6J8BFI4_MYTCO|nr:unnamed protein product [Mytilus coruscus]CAC5382424.1 unnamed protein product [Mytilus coruscus]
MACHRSQIPLYGKELSFLVHALYACELWGHLDSTEIGMLEQTQRYFTRFILCFDNRSPNDSCISNLGLWTIEGLIDKFKILFLGRLCRASVTTTHKQLFNLRLGQILSGDLAKLSITYDLIQTLAKYDMLTFLESYIDEAYIPDKRRWSKIVSQSITIFEENRWILSVQRRPELNRYFKIHSCLTDHRLVSLSATDPFFTRGLLLLIRLGSVAIKSGQCTLCNHFTDDIVKHLILNCKHIVNIRNEMFYAIVDLLSVQDSVKLFQQDEDDMLVTLLGGVNDYKKKLNSDVWKQLMMCLAVSEDKHQILTKCSVESITIGFVWQRSKAIYLEAHMLTHRIKRIRKETTVIISNWAMFSSKYYNVIWIRSKDIYLEAHKPTHRMKRIRKDSEKQEIFERLQLLFQIGQCSAATTAIISNWAMFSSKYYNVIWMRSKDIYLEAHKLTHRIKRIRKDSEKQEIFERLQLLFQIGQCSAASITM